MSNDSQTYRYAVIVEYDGSAFHGWQKQKHHVGATVQEELEKAISSVANQEVNVVCAGRTDRGVHATTQVVHFDTQAKRDNYNWLLGVNRYLPDGISVRWIDKIDHDFHARFSATSRCYRYFIYNEAVEPALFKNNLTWHRPHLDAEKMHEAAQYLVGKHDFTSYRAKHCQSHNAIRTVDYVFVKRCGSIIMMEIKANAFLYHMIRNIIGVLLPIGEGSKEVWWCKEVLVQKNRCSAGVTASEKGLYFSGVEYLPLYQSSIPSQVKGPIFVEGFDGCEIEYT
jgi:tRNA pseudouridine38-40 synthase